MKKTRTQQRGGNTITAAAHNQKVNPSYKIKIHLTDEGQDLLWFIVDTRSEKITSAGPFHNDLYAGKYVFCPISLRPGLHLEYSDTPIVAVHQPLTTIKYKITKIEKI